MTNAMVRDKWTVLHDASAAASTQEHETDKQRH